jgi:murein peptide amidase A
MLPVWGVRCRDERRAHVRRMGALDMPGRTRALAFVTLAIAVVLWAALSPAVPPVEAAGAGTPAIVVRPATGWQGRGVTLDYRVTGTTGASATLTIADGTGQAVATIAPKTGSTGGWQTARWVPAAAGEYVVTATASEDGGTVVSATAPVHVLALSSSVAGRSVRGRAVSVTSFGSGDRRMLLLGGVHGNEYGTPVARALESYLLAHPKALPAGARIDLVGCANPDGFAARTRANARRVDLNRNLPTRNWRRRLDPRDASSLLGLTGGRSPGSEPETRAVLGLLAGGYDVVVSLHSRAAVLDCIGPGAKALGRRMSALCGLPLGTVWYDPYITGSLGRYVPEKYRIPIVTVELRSARMDSGMRSALLEAASLPPVVGG